MLTRAYVSRGTALSMGDLSGLAASVSFESQRLAVAPHLLVTQLSAHESAISRNHVLNIDEDPISFERVAADSLGGASFELASGDIDGDGLLDVMALMGIGTPQPGVTPQALITVLGVEHEGERIAASWFVGEFDRPELWVQDFDGDGYDDILIIGHHAIGPGHVVVFRSGPR